MIEQLPSLALEHTTSFGLDAVSIHPEVVEDHVRRQEFSASAMNAMQGKCAAHWAVNYLLPRDDDPWSPAGAGNLVHDAFEDFYQLPPAARTEKMLWQLLHSKASDAIAGLYGHGVSAVFNRLRHGRRYDPMVEEAATEASMEHYRHSQQDNLGRALSEVDELTSHLWALACGLFDIEDPTTVVPVGNEVSIAGTIIDGVPLTGKIDRVDECDDGTVRILDYKTGAVRGVEGPYRTDPLWQVRVYVLAYQAMTGRRVSSAALYFTRAGEKVEVDISEELLAQTRTELTQAWERHNDYADAAQFPTTASPLCGWCPLVNLCPAAAAEGYSVSERADLTPLNPRSHRMPSGRQILDLATADPEDIITAETPEPLQDQTSEPKPASGPEQSTFAPAEDPDESPAPTLKGKTMTITDPITAEHPPYVAEDQEGNLLRSSYAYSNLLWLYLHAETLVEEEAPEAADTAEELVVVTFETMANAVASWCEELGESPNPQSNTFKYGSQMLQRWSRQHNPATAADLQTWLDQAVEHLLQRSALLEEKYLELTTVPDQE